MIGGKKIKNFDDEASLNTANSNRILDENTVAQVGQRFPSKLNKCFDVKAPPGKLGIIVEAENGGMPVVYGIKKDSPLFGRVRRGDHLCRVDGQNCMGMSTMEITKLLQSKKNKSSRVLEFSRPMR